MTTNTIINELFNYLLHQQEINTEDIYLVGGFLRDIMLAYETRDVDFAVNAREYQVAQLAKSIARRFHGSPFLMDEDNTVWRIVLADDYRIDIARLRGDSILSDLSERDFTVNAMAINVRHVVPSVNQMDMIDPFRGKNAIKRRVLVPVSKEIFRSDPVRILRAYRLAAQYDFRIPLRLRLLVRRRASELKRTSGERVWEELSKILMNQRSWSWLSRMEKDGVLSQIMPEVENMKKARDFYFHPSLWHHSIESLEAFEEILANPEVYFGDFAQKITEHFLAPVSGMVPKLVYDKLAVLLHDIGKPDTVTIKNGRVRFFGHEGEGIRKIAGIAERLKISRAGRHIMKTVVAAHTRPGTLTEVSEVTDRAIWRLFRDLKDETLDVLVASIADRLSYKRFGRDLTGIERHNKTVRYILERYYSIAERIKPLRLVNGNDIMETLSLSTGPKIGELLEKVVEAQADGIIDTKEQAIEYLKKIYHPDTPEERLLRIIFGKNKQLNT